MSTSGTILSLTHEIRKKGRSAQQKLEKPKHSIYFVIVLNFVKNIYNYQC